LIERGWWAARWCPGVIRLINSGGPEPEHVPERIIDALRKREVSGLIELPQAPPLRPGDKVRVTKGPLTNCMGLYVGMEPHERVEVLLTLLGSVQRVELDRRDIESV
jgi:transcription antitermination factor NusG